MRTAGKVGSFPLPFLVLAVLVAAAYLPLSSGSPPSVTPVPLAGDSLPGGVGTTAVSSPGGTASLGTLSCTSGLNGSCPHLAPSIQVANPNICAAAAPSCPFSSDARVTLDVNATGSTVTRPADVQVVFVVETTIFDGVFDPLTGDHGSSICGGPCAESNGVPYFVANAGQIATALAQEYGANLSTCAPGGITTMCFGMVDYFSTEGQDHDDGDGSEFHVDVHDFTPASSFQTAVVQTFQDIQLGGGWTYSDADYSDNVLSSSEITALFGVIDSPDFSWIPGDTHIIVQMGSTVPRDGNFIENYSVTHSDYNSGNTSACEPPYFPNQPNCLGWNETTNSIAADARAHNITVDTIDLADGMDMLYTGDYTNNGSITQTDVRHILQAGCAMALATGGSWEGPSSSVAGINFTCGAAPSGSAGQGNLTCVVGSSCEGRGAEENPNRTWASNAPLGWALTHVYIPGAQVSSNVSASGTLNASFTFVPAAGFEVDPVHPSFMTNCSLGVSSPPIQAPCSAPPAFTGLGPNGGIAWSWPSNTMYLGDKWSVSFNVVASPSFPTQQYDVPVPLDACLGAPSTSWSYACTPFPGGSPVDYSSVEYQPFNSTSYLTPAASFPPVWVVVHPVPGLQVNVSASRNMGEAPLRVNLTATLWGGAQAYTSEWISGAGLRASGLNLSATYDQPGVYTALFEVFVNNGTQLYRTASLGILVLPPLVGSLNVSHSDLIHANGTTGDEWCNYTFQGSFSGGLDPVQAFWSLDNVTVSPTGLRWNDTLEARFAPYYFLQVRFVDALGDVATAQEAFQFIGAPSSHPPPPPLSVTVSANTTQAAVGGTVLFNATPHSGEGVMSYTWQLDGTNISVNSSSLLVQFVLPGAFSMRAWIYDPWYGNYSTNVVFVNVTLDPSPGSTPPTSPPTGPPVSTPPTGAPIPHTSTSAASPSAPYEFAIALLISLVLLVAAWTSSSRERRKPGTEVRAPPTTARVPPGCEPL